MMRLGLTGYPLEHSLSAVLHEAALRACDLQGEYSLYPIRPGDTDALGRLIDCIRTDELAGLNVTIPHKRAVIPFLDDLTPAARAIGAVNTIYVRDGKALGANTDAPGFIADLHAFLPHPRSAIILGAGGAARAVAHGLRGSGCKVAVAARRVEQARDLARQFEDGHAIELSLEALRESSAELVVNATPVGMFPNIVGCPWPEGLPFPENGAVYDLIYNPRETVLLRRARAAGLKATCGEGMLVEQAALAFELWTGRKIPREPLHDALGRAAR